MKFTIALILHITLGFVLSLYTPWWSIILLSALLGSLIDLKAFPSFMAGFLGIGILWGVYAGWLDIQNEGILSAKISQLFKLSSPTNLNYITSVIGSLIGGLGTLTGCFGRQLVMPEDKKRRRYRY